MVAFQPHMVSRTRIFGHDMGVALGAADEVVVMDIYVAREDPEPGVSGALVADAVPLGAEHVVFEPSWSADGGAPRRARPSGRRRAHPRRRRRDPARPRGARAARGAGCARCRCLTAASAQGPTPAGHPARRRRLRRSRRGDRPDRPQGLPPPAPRRPLARWCATSLLALLLVARWSRARCGWCSSPATSPRARSTVTGNADARRRPHRAGRRRPDRHAARARRPRRDPAARGVDPRRQERRGLAQLAARACASWSPSAPRSRWSTRARACRRSTPRACSSATTPSRPKRLPLVTHRARHARARRSSRAAG